MTTSTTPIVIPVVDVDALLVQRGLEVAGRRGPAELIDDLGGAHGVIRRLAATLRSMGERRDGQAAVIFGDSEMSYRAPKSDLDVATWSMPVAWSSMCGAWNGSRGWRLTATLVVAVNDLYGDTSYSLSGCRLLASAAMTFEEAEAYSAPAAPTVSAKETVFVGVALSAPLERLFSQHLVRRAVRSIAGDACVRYDSKMDRDARAITRIDNPSGSWMMPFAPSATDDEWLRCAGNRVDTA